MSNLFANNGFRSEMEGWWELARATVAVSDGDDHVHWQDSDVYVLPSVVVPHDMSSIAPGARLARGAVRLAARGGLRPRTRRRNVSTDSLLSTMPPSTLGPVLQSVHAS